MPRRTKSEPPHHILGLPAGSGYFFARGGEGLVLPPPLCYNFSGLHLPFPAFLPRSRIFCRWRYLQYDQDHPVPRPLPGRRLRAHPAPARRGADRHHGLRHPEGPQHPGRHGPPGHPLRRHGLPRHHLRGHHPDRPGLRPQGVPPALRPHQLPQLPVRRGRHHQRGRPRLRPLRRQEVRR